MRGAGGTRTSRMPVQDPELFMAMDDLALVARGVVEGTLQGHHRSTYLGSSAEFSAHRGYERGDDLRTVNWKLWARQDRLFVKQSDAETNMNLWLFVDATASMSTAHGPATKRRYAARAGAALAYLALKMHDAPGLRILGGDAAVAVPPRTGPHQLLEIAGVLSNLNTAGRADLGRAIEEAAAGCTRRGLIVVISDLFDREEAILAAFDQLRFRGHEVLVIHVLDPWERELPERGTFRFRDLEAGGRLVVDVREVRDAYGSAVEAWRRSFKRACDDRGIDVLSCATTDPFQDLIVAYLAARAEIRR